MTSPSPSPVKRLPLNGRSASSGYSDLSPTGKPNGPKQAQQQQQQPQAPRAHYVTRHARNFSHGKGLNKAGKVNSMANIYGDGRNHQRKKSGPVTPSASPKPNFMNRNSSHIVLPKNTSHGNLRKNQSASTLAALNRNLSHGALRKLGAPPSQKAREKEQNKQGVFDLGDQSSADEEEGEWEDSTTQSPELTRNNSKTATPAGAHSPKTDATQLPPEPHALPEKTSSPPHPSLKNNNRSAPDLRRYDAVTSQEQRNPPPDPSLLYQNGRASRAPPAVSAANATGNSSHIKRNESMKSLQASKDGQFSQPESVVTPGIGQSSSGSVTVSHFLPTDGLSTTSSKVRVDSDDEDASTFMTNYRPQVSQSPEKPRTLFNKPRVTSGPSRTQQKLELQRREAMRGSGTTPTSAAGSGIGIGAGSSLSLHTRGGSKGRARLSTGEVRVVKQDYETAIKLLTVVRRFRNPVLESLQRLKDTEVLASDVGAGNAANAKQGRPPSRHGRRMNGSTKTASTTATASLEDKKSSNQPSRSSSRVRGSRVQFQLSRQGSHDDMLTTSQGSPEVHDYDADGLSPEQALIRRMWESRVEVG